MKRKRIEADYRDEVILIISDLHLPYHHQDAFAFLANLKKTYKPDRVVNIGDLYDCQAFSFHDHDPDLLSPGDELEAARAYGKRLGKLFPIMDITLGNHDSLPARKLKAMGLPREVMKDYEEIYQTPPGWEFITDLTIGKSDGNKHLPDLHFVHGLSKDNLKLAAQRGQRIINGHFHEKAGVEYISNPDSLIWSMTVGCLIDKSSPAFDYNKTNKNRPILGSGVIVNGVACFEPMILDKDGRWIGE